MSEYRYTACGGVVVSGSKVLVLRRVDQVRLPKGHLEDGETFEEAALREVFEETGFSELVIQADLGTQLVEFDVSGRHWSRTERYFLVSLRTPDEAPSGSGEPQFEVLWLDWDDAISQLTFEAEREWVRRARPYAAGAL